MLHATGVLFAKHITPEPAPEDLPMAEASDDDDAPMPSAEYAARQVRGFAPTGGRQPLSWSPFFCIFCSFDFSRDRQCHGTRKCPHRLPSDKLSHVVVPEPIEGQYTRVAASEARPQHSTRRTTHVHANISNKHTNRATHHKNETGTSVVRGGRVLNARLTCRAGHGFRAAGTVQPRTCRPEKTEEREADLAGGRAALDCVTVTLRYAHAKI